MDGSLKHPDGCLPLQPLFREPPTVLGVKTVPTCLVMHGMHDGDLAPISHNSSYTPGETDSDIRVVEVDKYIVGGHLNVFRADVSRNGDIVAVAFRVQFFR